MKRDDFLKKLALGLGTIAVAPTVLSAKDKPSIVEHPEEPISLAIDINSISHISGGGHLLTPMEIIDLYHQTGILLYASTSYKGYSCEPPIVIRGKIKAIDISTPEV